MKGLHLLMLNGALSAMLILAASQSVAQDQSAGAGPRNPIPSGGGQTGPGGATGVGTGGGHFGRARVNDVFLVEEQVIEVVEPKEEEAKPAPPPAAPPAAEPEKREPFKIGNSYDTLPPGCMKMIQEGASYYFCSGGEWYQRVEGKYLAVEQP